MNPILLAAIQRVVGTGMARTPGGFSRSQAMQAVMGAAVIDCAWPSIGDRTI
jgi:hypothetical protein